MSAEMRSSVNTSRVFPIPVLLTVENGMKQNELLASAAREGIRVYGLSAYYFFPVANMPENIIVAGFSGLNTEQLVKGGEALKRAWNVK